MKKLFIIFILSILLTSSALGVTQYLLDNTSGRGIYRIYDLTSITATNLYGILNASYISNAPWITSYTETDPIYSAWDKDYDDLTNKPNLSIYYLASNPNGYISSYTETDPIFVAGNSSIWSAINLRYLKTETYNRTEIDSKVSAVNETGLINTQTIRIDNLNSTKAFAGSSAICTYGIANITLNAQGVPTVTCATAQGDITGVTATGPGLTGGGTTGALTIGLNETYVNSKWNDTTAINAVDSRVTTLNGTKLQNGSSANLTELTVSGNVYVGNNGTEGNKNIFFYENGNPSQEYFSWSDGGSRFDMSDDLLVGGNVYTNYDIYTSSSGADSWWGNASSDWALSYVGANGSARFNRSVSSEVFFENGSSLNSKYNYTSAIALKLDITDQRYNESSQVSSINTTLMDYFDRVDCNGENVFLFGQDVTYNYCKTFNSSAANIQLSDLDPSSFPSICSDGYVMKGINNTASTCILDNSRDTLARAGVASVNSTAVSALNTATTANNTANAALPKSGGTISGNISLGSNLGFYYNATNYLIFNGTCWITRSQNTYDYNCP